MKVNEIFLSIQGEGIATGYPTIFVRFTGCNLRCSYCDTTYAYNIGTEMSVDEVYEEIRGFKYMRVCLTGGEPLLQQDIKILLDKLSDYEVSIETNGAVSVEGIINNVNHRVTMDMKVPSSGESGKMKFENFNYLKDTDEIKFVIGNLDDYKWAKEIIGKFHKRGIVTISPVFGKIDSREIVENILNDGLDVRFQIQLHKVIWDPAERGV